MKNWRRNFPNKTPWTREEVMRLRDMLNDGVPIDEIATEVGHSRIACRNKAHLQGYSTARSRQADKNRSVKNPFLMPSLGPGVQTIDSADRIAASKNFNIAECRAALQLPDLQKTVRQAIERRLKKVKI